LRRESYEWSRFEGARVGINCGHSVFEVFARHFMWQYQVSNVSSGRRVRLETEIWES
jgi:hypothetical protein